MNYLARVTGTVHSIDPIFNETGYARAVFGNHLHNVRVKAEGRKLHFQVVGLIKMTDNSSLAEFTQGLITGDDTNVEWNISLQCVRASRPLMAVA